MNKKKTLGIRAFAVTSDYSEQGQIIFANSAVEAIGITQSYDCFEDFEYIDLRVKREPWADKYLKDELENLDFCSHASDFKSNGWSCLDPCYDVKCCFNDELEENL